MKISEALPAKLGWQMFKWIGKDGIAPKLAATDETPDFVDKADLGDVVVYRYGFKPEGSYIGNAPSGFAIYHKDKLVSASKEVTLADKNYKTMEKEYAKLAKELNGSAAADKGEPIADPIPNEWLEFIPERKEKLITAMTEMEAAIAEKGIWKPDFLAIKEIIDDGISMAEFPCIDHAVKSAKISGSELLMVIRETIKGKKPAGMEKALEAYKANEAVKFFIKLYISPTKELMSKLDELKDLIRAGRKPTPPRKPVYVPPYSAAKDLAAVKKVYDDMIEDIRDKLIDSLVKRDMDRGPLYMEALNDAKIKKKDWEFIGRNYDKAQGVYALKQQKEREANNRKAAEKEAHALMQMFISKNMSKVNSLVGEKGNFESVKEVGVYVDNGVLSGEIAFKFKDGSSFIVRNQLVSVWVWDREPYVRFPTTFHDIVFANGRKVKHDSEEFMNTVWAKEKNIPENLKMAERVLFIYENRHL